MGEVYFGVAVVGLILTVTFALICFIAVGKRDFMADFAHWIGVGTLVSVGWPLVVVAIILAGPFFLIYCVKLAVQRLWFERVA